MLECRRDMLSNAPGFEVGDGDEIGNRIVSGLLSLASVFSHERIKASPTRIVAYDIYHNNFFRAIRIHDLPSALA